MLCALKHDNATLVLCLRQFVDIDNSPIDIDRIQFISSSSNVSLCWERYVLKCRGDHMVMY